MNTRIFLTALIINTLLLTSCSKNIEPPKPYGPVPTENQLNWHEMEYYSLVCYGLNTYTGQEWGYGDVDPKVFNPSDLDTDQWCKVSKEAGMKGMILVAKHHDGFCLWPSKTTDYTVAATPWKKGKGDVLGDLAKSCKKYGLKLGIYISPWDRNHAEYGKPEYVEAYHKQWREALEYSDEIFEAWFDGANGGTGYYGGARENRKIQKGYYQFPKIFKLIKDKHPKAVLFGYVENVTEDVIRWGGTEEGTGSATNWCRYDDVTSSNWEVARTGVKDGNYWMPVEGNTTILHPKKWYYNESSKPRTLKNFVDLYYSTIGQNATFILGLSIGPDGKIPERDVNSMLAQKKQIDKELATNLASTTNIISDNSRDKTSFRAQMAIDGSTDTYWATSDSVQKASLTLDFRKEITFNRLLLQECIKLGQRVHKFNLEAYIDDTWKEVANGTTIGYKRILRFGDTKARKVKLTLETDAPCLTLSNLEIYNAPPLLADPEITSDKKGNLTFKTTKGLDVFYAVGKTPKETDFKRAEGRLQIPDGGTIHAYALDKESGLKTDIVSREIGIAKSKWKVHSVSGNSKAANPATNAIDGDPKTYWISDKVNKSNFISVNLGKEEAITGFAYTPLGLGSEGIIFEYEFYVSSDGKTWGAPIRMGEFSNIKNNPIRQLIKFDKPVRAKFIKLISKSTVRNSSQISIAEIDIFAEE